MDRRRRYALPFAGVWLVVLLGPAGDVLDRTSGLGSVVGVALLVLFGALYLVVVATSFERRRAWRIQLLVAAMLLVACAALPFSGQSGLTMFVFVGVALQLVLPWRAAIAATAAVVALLLVIERVAGWTDAWSYAFSVVAAAMAMFGVVRMSERTRAELEAETERASYAVVAERERMASDLHDVLGHSLTVIAVKSELAGRLLDVDPERARAEVADIERLAREALADARATVGNYRDVSLAAELVAARRALDAAGIEPDLPNAVDEVPGRLRQVFGYVVREGVTNVVRHSGAGRCTVRLGSDRVEVLDDGRGAPAAPDSTSSGLEGLRRRAELAGCVLEAGARTGGGYRLAVVVAP